MDSVDLCHRKVLVTFAGTAGLCYFSAGKYSRRPGKVGDLLAPGIARISD